MSWHLDTWTLQMLVAVAEAPSAARTAARLDAKPSAVSHRMRKAKADLRAALFERREAMVPPDARGRAALCGRGGHPGPAGGRLVPSRVLPRGAARVPLFEDRLVGEVPAGHRLARGRSLAEGACAAETYVSHCRVKEDGLEDDLLFRPARSGPARFRLADSVEAILDLVAALDAPLGAPLAGPERARHGAATLAAG